MGGNKTYPDWIWPEHGKSSPAFAQTTYTKSTILDMEIQYLNISQSKSGYGTKNLKPGTMLDFFIS